MLSFLSYVIDKQNDFHLSLKVEVFLFSDLPNIIKYLYYPDEIMAHFILPTTTAATAK